MARISEIYGFINEIAPFSWQEGYDNSGLVIGNMQDEVTRILVALDCTREVAQEAAEKKAQLIVTHHPVIFRALKRLDPYSVPGMLLGEHIGVISAHTNFDAARLNTILCEKLGLEPEGGITEENGVAMGCICPVEDITAEDMARTIKERLGNRVVRFNDCGKALSRIAVCSGSGGSFLGDVLAQGCDGFITGDVKHDIFIDAHNAGLTVFDAGHFHTEDIFCPWMKDALKERFSDISVEVAGSDRDILSYI